MTIEVAVKGYRSWTILRFQCPFCHNNVSWGFWRTDEFLAENAVVFCKWNKQDELVGCGRKVFRLERK